MLFFVGSRGATRIQLDTVSSAEKCLEVFVHNSHAVFVGSSGGTTIQLDTVSSAEKSLQVYYDIDCNMFFLATPLRAVYTCRV